MDRKDSYSMEALICSLQTLTGFGVIVPRGQLHRPAL